MGTAKCVAFVVAAIAYGKKHCGSRHISFSLAERKCICKFPSHLLLHRISLPIIDMLYYYLQLSVLCLHLRIVVFVSVCLFAVVRWGEGENFFTGPSKRDRERESERAIERERET